MAYDLTLAERIRRVLQSRAGYTEKEMFGGICYLINGNMCCGIVKQDLMLRVGPDMHDSALAAPHTRVMDFAGRPSRGMVYVEPAGIASDAALRKWIEMAVRFAAGLPVKKKKSRLAKKGKAAEGSARARPAKVAAAENAKSVKKKSAARTRVR